MNRDFYAILGVPRDADTAAIKKAYRVLAMKWHPDKNPNDVEHAEKMFTDISDAYQVLSDPEKRRLYDVYGEDYEKITSGQSEESGNYRNHMNADNLFNMFFGHNRGFGHSSAPFSSFFDDPFFGFSGMSQPYEHVQQEIAPVYVDLECSLEDLHFGKTKEVRYKRYFDGKKERNSVKIDIPIGTREDDVLTLRGEGNSFNSNCGDLCIRIVLEGHACYKLKGDDLYTKLRIPLKNALTGFNMSIYGIDGNNIEMPIEGIIAPNSSIKIKGKGMSKKNGKRGNVYVFFDVVFPKKLSSEVLDFVDKNFPEK